MIISTPKTGKKIDKAAAKSWTEISLGDKVAATATREIWRKTSLGNKAAAAAKSEITKETSLGQGGSNRQKRNHEGRQTSQTTWQRQPKTKPWRGTSTGTSNGTVVLPSGAFPELMAGDALPLSFAAPLRGAAGGPSSWIFGPVGTRPSDGVAGSRRLQKRGLVGIEPRHGPGFERKLEHFWGGGWSDRGRVVHPRSGNDPVTSI